MSRIMTCRNGLVWQARLAAAEQGRRARFAFVAAIGLGLMVTSARGGSLDAPAGPNSPDSAMWTLNDIYNKLDTRAAVSKRTGVFTEPSGGPTSGTMHTLNEIMTLVTNRAPVEKTGQTTFYWVGDDAWWSTNNVGVTLPKPRFTIQGNTNASDDVLTNCVRDNLTGLIWARNANLASNTTWATGWSSVKGTCTWYQAFDVITNSAGPVNGTAKYGGTNDWRMPNVKELVSLIDCGYGNPALCNTAGTGKWSEGNPFTGVKSVYWSSNGDASAALLVYMFDPYGRIFMVSCSDGTKTVSTAYVWPVRGGQ